MLPSQQQTPRTVPIQLAHNRQYALPGWRRRVGIPSVMADTADRVSDQVGTQAVLGVQVKGVH